MRIEPDKKLFVGVRIDNKLRDALAQCPGRDKAFFDGTDPRYLTVLRSADHSYIGKVIDGEVAAVGVDDLKRNILSLLNRLAMNRRSEDDVKVWVVGDGEPPPLPVREPSPYDRY